MSTTHSLPDRGQVRGQVAGEVRAQLARGRMNLANIAKITGRSHTYWWRRVTSEETPLDIDDLADLASILGVDITAFFVTVHNDESPRSRNGENGGSTRARRDSNPQPSDPYTDDLADVIDLESWVLERTG